MSVGIKGFFPSAVTVVERPVEFDRIAAWWAGKGYAWSGPTREVNPETVLQRFRAAGDGGVPPEPDQVAHEAAHRAYHQSSAGKGEEPEVNLVNNIDRQVRLLKRDVRVIAQTLHDIDNERVVSTMVQNWCNPQQRSVSIPDAAESSLRFSQAAHDVDAEQTRCRFLEAPLWE